MSPLHTRPGLRAAQAGSATALTSQNGSDNAVQIRIKAAVRTALHATGFIFTAISLASSGAWRNSLYVAHVTRRCFRETESTQRVHENAATFSLHPLTLW
jgi:hypothetical protein